MSLEDLEKELYGQKNKIERKSFKNSDEKKDDFSDASFASPWDDSQKESSFESAGVTRAIRWGKAFFITLISILIILLGIAGYYLYQYFTTKDVSLFFSGPSETLAGVPFVVGVNFENVSQKSLISPRMSLSLPDGFVFLDDVNKRIITKDLSSILPSQSVKEEFNVMIVGESSKTYQLEGSISYTYDSSSFSNRFDKKQIFEILARDPVLSLDISAPDKILNGEDFEVAIKYRNLSNLTLDQADINIKMPEGFNLANSDHDIKDSVVHLENISGQKEGVINLSGFLVGKEYSYSNIETIALVIVGGNSYPINTKTSSLSIIPSPLALSIGLANQDNVIYPGQGLSFNVNFTNNSDINLSDVILSAKLEGNSFDFSSVQSNGYFDFDKKNITWTAANLSVLKKIDAKQSGSTSFKVNLAPNYPILNLSDKDFVIKVSGLISSPTVPYNVVAKKTVGVAAAEYKIGGSFNFNQIAYFAEPSLDIQNSGSLPPRVGRPVQYTIHWKLNTRATEFKDIKASAFLGAGVRWTGKIKTNNISSVPVYNERTQEITWEISGLPANSGLMGGEPEAIFQVEFVPSINQVDTRFTLVSNTKVSAVDSFTGKTVEISPKSLESKDLGDYDLPSKFDYIQP